MRLVLIDKNNQVCGDTAALALRFPEWNEIAAEYSKDNVEGWATVAARLLDERLGRHCRDYKFSPFAPKGASEGYFVFDCDGDESRAPPVILDGVDPEDITPKVMTACFYVGYVRCDH